MMRILDGTAVEELFSPKLALTTMRELFTISADPTAVGYGRIDISHPAGWLRLLPGFIRPLGVFGFKTLHRTDGVGMRYAIYVHDMTSGELAGIVDGLTVTNLRTGAVSALATDLMASPDVQTAAIVGTGPVARGQVEVLDLVRPVAQLRVFARTPENRRRFIADMEGTISSTLVEAGSMEEAIDGASLVTLATKASTPILFSHHLRPGMHVNSVGPASRDRVEVDPSAFGDFHRVVCDSVALVTDEAGDAFRAVQQGYDPKRAVDLAPVVTGEEPGRADASDITLFKSVGTGLQDLMVAARLLEAAAGADTGATVDRFISVKSLPPR